MPNKELSNTVDNKIDEFVNYCREQMYDIVPVKKERIIARILVKHKEVIRQREEAIIEMIDKIELSPEPEDLENLEQLKKDGSYAGFGYGQVWMLKRIVNKLKE